MTDATACAAKAADVDPIAARMFARRCPGVQLIGLGIFLRPNYPRSHVWLRFEGPGDLVADLGLLEPAMIPPKPKRQLFTTVQHGDDEEAVWVQRKARGFVQARRELLESFPANHALAFLAPYNHPLADTFVEKRDQFMSNFECRGRELLGFVRGMSRMLLDEGIHGLRIDEGSHALISGVFSAFDTDLRAALSAARVESPKRRNPLRLVVDNSREELPRG